mmetsp:Transcript_19412/g.44221  ORF Transcript_19412/g.44221 Transcript_19412/m.44221 type:complete len:234 (-) Transcript_19412:223-924(-)
MTSSEPLNPIGSPMLPPQRQVGNNFNDTSQPRISTIEIESEEQNKTFLDHLTGYVTRIVSMCCTPQQILIVMRLLKAVTFCFLILNVAADVMVLCFLGLGQAASANNVREFIIRFYGMGLSVMAVAFELDITNIVDMFRGLKGYIPRALLLLLISIITQNKGNYPNDDQKSVIVFQFVTSFVILICALVYFILGLLCCDRFTSRLFLQSKDPTVSTAIPRSLVRTEEPPFQTA